MNLEIHYIRISRNFYKKKKYKLKLLKFLVNFSKI